MHAADPADPETKALACYGLWLPERERMLLRFVAGRPVSPVTCAFLAWAAQQMTAEGMRVLVVIWDNAAWHVSHEVRGWIREHNRRVKRDGGCRLLICRLPSKSPWLNPIEPRWAHGKRAVAEPERRPSATIEDLDCPGRGLDRCRHLVPVEIHAVALDVGASPRADGPSPLGVHAQA